MDRHAGATTKAVSTAINAAVNTGRSVILAEEWGQTPPEPSACSPRIVLAGTRQGSRRWLTSRWTYESPPLSRVLSVGFSDLPAERMRERESVRTATLNIVLKKTESVELVGSALPSATQAAALLPPGGKQAGPGDDVSCTCRADVVATAKGYLPPERLRDDPTITCRITGIRSHAADVARQRDVPVETHIVIVRRASTSPDS